MALSESFVTLSIIFWTIYLLALAQNCLEKMWCLIVSMPDRCLLFLLCMSTYYAPLVAPLLLFYYDRNFMLPLFENNQADTIEAFNSTFSYLDDLIDISKPSFE